MKAEIRKGAGVFCGVNRCIYIDIDSDLRMYCFIYANGIEFILIALWLIISWRGECFHSDCSTFILAFFFPSDVRYAEEPKLMWLYVYCQWLHGKPLSDCSHNVNALRANVMTSLSGSRDTTLSGNQGIVQFENLDNAAWWSSHTRTKVKGYTIKTD